MAWEGSQDGSCCDSPRSFAEEPSSACQRYTEVRNITKGRCALHGVEVSYCSGRCASRTNVISEVSESQRARPGAWPGLWA